MEFGLDQNASVSAREIVEEGLHGTRFQLVSDWGEVSVKLGLAGRHNVFNALAASAAALAVGAGLAEIATGLAAVQPQSGRLSVNPCKNGALVIDDSYNANPRSVEAAIDLLASCGGRRVLVLGAMKELGDDSELLHEQIGCYAQRSGIDELWLTGAETTATARGFGKTAVHCLDREELALQLQNRFGEGDVVLVKGSRSAGMENIVTALLDQANGGS